MIKQRRSNNIKVKRTLDAKKKDLGDNEEVGERINGVEEKGRAKKKKKQALIPKPPRPHDHHLI